MQNPMFKMEGVIKSSHDMEDFEGPLTLLLHLLSKNKVEIQDIKISEILEQYLDYLDSMKEMDLEIASEFVQMASHLVYIKTKTLLNEEEEIPELEMLKMSMEELKNRDIYKQIKSLSDTFKDMSINGAGYIQKPQEYLEGKTQYRFTHDAMELLNALIDAVSMGTELTHNEGREFIMPTRIVYSVSDKADEILDKLKQIGDISVTRLFHQAKSRSEIVATLIAILELCKMGSIAFEGSQEEDDFVVLYVDAPVASVTAE